MNDGIENLKPYQSEDEAREGGRKGGIASGAARRRKRDMREWAEILGQTLMTMRTPDGKGRASPLQRVWLERFPNTVKIIDNWDDFLVVLEKK